MTQQSNPYKGSPPRAWVRLLLLAEDGTSRQMDLLADTGSPCAFVVGVEQMRRFRQVEGPSLNSNFGPLDGGWARVLIPEISFDHYLLGYASEEVVASTRLSSPDFEGLAGLPLLRLVQYGGNADWFWLLRPGHPQT